MRVVERRILRLLENTNIHEILPHGGVDQRARHTYARQRFELSVYATVAVLSHETGYSLGSGVRYEVFRTKVSLYSAKKKGCSKEINRTIQQ